MQAQRKVRLLVMAGVGVGVAVGLGAGGFWWHERRIASIVIPAVPAIPAEVASWPPDYAVRVRVATEAANRLWQPVTALREIAFLYHANNAYPEARQAELGLHRLEPDNGQWTYFLADACEKLGDTDAERADLERTAALAPYYPPARLRLADLLLKQGATDAAEAQYQRFLALVPQEPHGRLGLARILIERGDRNGAIRDLEALVSDHPSFSAGHNLLCELYTAAGDTKRAEAQRRLSGATGEGQTIDDPWLHWLYAWSFDAFRAELAGGTDAQNRAVQEASLRFYEKLARVDPDAGPACDALGGLELQLKRLGDAVAVLEQGIGRAPGYAGLYDTLARAQREQGHVQRAIATLQQGMRAVPASPLLPFALGSVLDGEGRRDDAMAAYHQALRLNPGYAEARWSLGLCLLDLGKLPEAKDELGRALDVQPRKAEVLLARAEDALGAGKLDLFSCCVHALIEHSPGMPLRDLLQRALAAAQKKGDAALARDLEQLLALPLP